uniref:Uncharacterized protein n=1 Tax=Fagus sylvatica TaxID=28930 RepID=A0A2N9I0H7_FAGSY
MIPIEKERRGSGWVGLIGAGWCQYPLPPRPGDLGKSLASSSPHHLYRAGKICAGQGGLGWVGDGLWVRQTDTSGFGFAQCTTEMDCEVGQGSRLVSWQTQPPHHVVLCTEGQEFVVKMLAIRPSPGVVPVYHRREQPAWQTLVLQSSPHQLSQGSPVERTRI